MKGSMVRRNGKKVVQSIIKVLTELIKLHWDVKLVIEVFFVSKHIFFTIYSTKICYSTVTHLVYIEKEYIWEALLVTYNMYLHQAFPITVISGDQECSVLNHLTTVLPSAPCLDWEAASQHCGLIQHNICFLKEKLSSLCHSLPFTMVPGIMVVHTVLHIIKFVSVFPCQGHAKHFSPGEIMMDHHLHKSNIVLSFWVYCQAAENIQPWKVLLHRLKLQFWWAVWTIFPAVRFSLRWIQASW